MTKLKVGEIRKRIFWEQNFYFLIVSIVGRKVYYFSMTQGKICEDSMSRIFSITQTL